MAGGPQNYRHSKCSRPDTGASDKVALIAYKPIPIHKRMLARAGRNCVNGCRISAIHYETVVHFAPRNEWNGITRANEHKEWSVFRRFTSNLVNDPNSGLGYWVSGCFGHASVFVPFGGSRMIIFGTHRDPHGEDQASYVPSGKLILHNVVGEYDFSAQDEEIEKIGILV